jgi:hypothetical protein
MARKGIPENIRVQLEETVNRFNDEIIQDPDDFYHIRYRGNYVYLGRETFGTIYPICRLRYTGKVDGWEFAIYKYSDERYDPDEWMFPGAEHLDGTVEGALRAGLEAYP